jgi:serine/threonine protein kinase
VEAPHGYLQFDKYTIMDLADWAHKATLQQGASQAQAVETLRCAAIAVMHVHGADYVHGDINPQNFLVDLVAAGDYYVANPLLCDFETLREHEASVRLATSTSCSATRSTLAAVGGTDGFLAPEICLEGRLELPRDPMARPTKASDVFALGRTFSHVSNGQALLIKGITHCW